MMGLTLRQQECLVFVDQQVREQGFAPSFNEIAVALGVKSKSSVYRLIGGLEQRGYIRRMGRRARAIEVLHLPGNLSGRQSPAHSRTQVSRGILKERATTQLTEGAVIVPMVGRVDANGTAIEALQNTIYDAVVGASMISRGTHYALEVIGDAMIGAGIIDGDTLLIREVDKAVSGDLVIVLVDRERVLLRRWRSRGENVLLEPANPAYETRLYGPSRVAIQGRVVGMIRRY